MRMTHLAAIAALALCLPARAAENKVGVVNLQEALNSVEEGKTAKAQLKKEFESKQKVITEREEEIRKLQGDFQKQQSVMNEETRNQRQEEIARKAQDLQTTYVTLQKELQDRERDLTRGIFEKMAVIVREIATADGFSVVVDGQAVMYADPSFDVTNELVRKYNARHKPGSEPASKPSAEAKKPAAKADAKKSGK
ncbi:MAG TPA: OmpH family outer membrane protein [Anaeromyxobacteraceae bacterium]|nr:OmpH family outer membrane protein [Anaeromyxobacteraceae bacterium]